MTTTPIKKIAIFGHYGNLNLGDEAIIEAMLNHIDQRVPQAKLIGMSINPVDTASRHRVESFAIRYRHDQHHGPITPEQADQFLLSQAPRHDRAATNDTAALSNKSLSWKQRLKRLPVLGSILRGAQNTLEFLVLLKREIQFLRNAYQYLKTVDLLIVTGSNQFLDNFGGAWGFPYTLLKWSILAKLTKTKIAFASVGAGPLSLPLSYRMLAWTLRNCDFLSYRDEGSKALVETRIDNIDGQIFPDIAHSLDYSAIETESNNKLTIAINPMPVYDKRYWAEPNEAKYRDYVSKVSTLCKTVLDQGHHIKLFSTQAKDSDVMDDIVALLSVEKSYQEDQLQIINDKTVSDLMATFTSADIVVATRFHATVLPLQLNKPVLGICYYRKAAELLDDVGLGDYHVPIDDFSSESLVQKLNHLIDNREQLKPVVAQRYKKYSQALDDQYQQLVALLGS